MQLSIPSAVVPNQAPTNMNDGPWTKAEHILFLRGLVMYGKNWFDVQQVVKSRDQAQVRSHAQKFFRRMQKRNFSLAQVVSKSKHYSDIIYKPVLTENQHLWYYFQADPEAANFFNQCKQFTHDNIGYMRISETNDTKDI